jgi:hypothetical protein
MSWRSFAADHVGARADQVRERARELGDAPVLGGVEELPRDVLLRGEAVLEALQVDAVTATRRNRS